MPYSFTLSPAAVDLLLEQQGLGRPPVPFVVPHIGITGEERRRIRDAVTRDLEGRGLVSRRGYLDDDLEQALATFARGRLAVTSTAQLDDGQLFARVTSTGDHAVLVRHDDGMFVFEEVRPTGLVPAIVDLLPPGTPGPGTSVTITRPPKQPRRGAAYDPFARTSAPRDPQARAVERIFEKPRLRVGQFTVGGQQPLVWFDTEAGRYLLSTRVADDGQRWLTYAPADNSRLAQQLSAQVQANA
ncbi:ESX secretion-associated protein EspG [Amycolatopsis sp. FDAARGOS 1241]|uniref:ESX secretion-associated protein EspG n=1 Tax=Amycolatopsis sp. FDAARGOS 1241 TaxID=2778070 RepID=UPI0019500F3D|nr:ESX secretion-associated protein EspG [Amycolatopsis sp. FDAARGOS 1241]QRP45836.1 ESX secretion-associated protein EspG [Amycolatopsis sp. FDAARGOS 1241]